ncbi:hypothetical protein ACFSQP_10775 [Bizionia sediminis]|uniref:Uncharacterized protein n=1 Tax=Bizionia sediminis TaxID=1737064 RepID=A0ABW5KUP7_9FLAO
MDLNTIIIGLIITAVIVVPIAYIQWSQKIEKKKTKTAFINNAKQNKIQVSHMDFWGTYYGIGLDSQKNVLVYSKKTEENPVWLSVNLNTIKTCYIDTVTQHIKTKTANKVETERLNLVLKTKHAQDTVVLEFYNVDVNFEMTTEHPLLQKWQNLITAALTTSKMAA